MYKNKLRPCTGTDLEQLHNSATMYNPNGSNHMTYPQFGLEMAHYILQNRSEADKRERPACVIMFTDGTPGNESGGDDGNGYYEADEAVKKAATLKSAASSGDKSKVYVIGLLSSDSGTLNGNKRNPFTNEAYTGADKTTKNFLDAVSSNCPNATDLWTLGADVDLSAGYYERTTSGTGLSDKFKAVASTISETDVSVNANSVLSDTINTSNLEVPADFASNKDTYVTASTVTADEVDSHKNIHWKEKTIDGVKMEDEQTLTKPEGFTGDLITVTGNKVDVQGFNYSDNYTAYNESDTSQHKLGQKLIVRISGLKPEQGGEALLSNTAAGIYTKQGDPEPFLDVDSPDYTIPIVSKVIDFNKKMSFGANSSEDLYKTKGTNGTFALESNNLTYQLKYNGTDTTTIDGVGLVMGAYDTTMTYEEKPDGTKGEVLKVTPGWTQFFAVPANNVYFDDEFLTATSTTVDVRDGSGYNPGVSSAAVSTTNGTTNFAITFTGKRIDLYCTTDAIKNGLTATLTKDGSRVMFVANNAPDAANRFTVQNQFDDTKALTNVPTLSIVPEDGFGTYTVNLTATKDFRLDGVRVYNPVEETDETVKKVYADEQEQNAVFQPVRALLLEQSKVEAAVTTAENDEVNGAVYIESNYEAEESATLAKTYEKAGPKNEVYLDPGNGVGVQIHADGFKPGYQVWVGLSAPAGKSATVKVSGWDAENNQAASYVYNVTSNVDMYYPVVPDANGNVYIYNTPNGDGEDQGMISVTNIKITGEQKLLFGAAANPAAKFTVNRSLMSYAKNFDTLTVVNPDAVSVQEPVSTPEPEPTQNPTIGELIHQIISSFVNSLFASIARLFGN